MSVVPLTLAISLGLVAVFVIFFLREHARSRAGGAERDSLLPLAEETPRPVAKPAASHDHDENDGCGRGLRSLGEAGCRDGRRAPCAGCLKPRAPAA